MAAKDVKFGGDARQKMLEVNRNFFLKKSWNFINYNYLCVVLLMSVI